MFGMAKLQSAMFGVPNIQFSRHDQPQNDFNIVQLAKYSEFLWNAAFWGIIDTKSSQTMQPCRYRNLGQNFEHDRPPAYIGSRPTAAIETARGGAGGGGGEGAPYRRHQTHRQTQHMNWGSSKSLSPGPAAVAATSSFFTGACGWPSEAILPPLEDSSGRRRNGWEEICCACASERGRARDAGSVGWRRTRGGLGTEEARPTAS